MATADYQFRDDVTASDVAHVRRIVTATGMFSDQEIALAVELVEEYLAKGEASGYGFVFSEEAAGVRGYACYGPIPATESSYDLYWIAVEPGQQRRGMGRALLVETERRIAAAGGQRIYVDTSGRAQYAPTRGFYEANGYAQAAALPDFYAPGDAKIVYVKHLSTAQGE